MALYHTLVVVIYFLYLFLIHPHLCFTIASKNFTGFSLKLIHRDSPESPLYPGDLTINERMSRYAKWSVVRASHLASIASQNATIMDNPNSIMRPPVFNDGTLYYMVSIGIGTPAQDVILLLDTGAHLTWTQCRPCESCYYQKDPIYDSLTSETFKPIHCNHTLCSDILTCTADACWYHIYYGSGSHTSGLAITETLTFGTDDRRQMHVGEVVIGCSKNNQNFPFGSPGNVGGIMGLNQSPLSLVNQLGDMIERKFSYCLTPGERLSSYLRFGSDIVVRGIGTVQRTPFVSFGAYYFGLNLQDISIADRRIGYPKDAFAQSGGAGGCVIDSGSPFTNIEQAAFDTFIAAFENYFAPIQLVRDTRDCISPTSYCYYSKGVKSYPSITLHFENGANYVMPVENVIWLDTLGKYFMLMISPSSDITILGAWQQHNVRLVYDLNEGYLSFVPEICSNDVS